MKSKLPGQERGRGVGAAERAGRGWPSYTSWAGQREGVEDSVSDETTSGHTSDFFLL